MQLAVAWDVVEKNAMSRLGCGGFEYCVADRNKFELVQTIIVGVE